jgi:hypothetical protein
MHLFRKKPVIIEAVQFESLALLEGEVFSIHFNTAEALPKGVRDAIIDDTLCPNFKDGKSLVVTTLEGDHIASPGDWIIRGVEGELCPCKPNIFAQTYEPVDEQDIEVTGVAI